MSALPAHVFEELGRGADLITANQRAARALRRDYDVTMRAAGNTLWQAPSILAVDSWMRARWHRMMVAGQTGVMLLNSTQERKLWEAVVTTDTTVRRPRGVAVLAMEAWARLWLHGGRPQQENGSVDTKAFAAWAQLFAQSCKNHGWLSFAQLPETLGLAVKQNQTVISNQLFLSGFDGLTPAHEALFATVNSAGGTVERLPEAKLAPILSLVQTSGEDDELEAAARWARRALEKDPASRLGVIVPGLADRHGQIQRVFNDILYLSGNPEPYEFSLGVPLSRTSLAADALDLLRWQTAALPVETVSSLLRSPYFGGSLGTPELRAASEFDAFELRRTAMLQPQVTLEQLAALLERSPRRPALVDLLARVRAMHLTAEAARASQQKEKTFTAWTSDFSAVLETARWSRRAGDTALSYQTMECWKSALDELATLDFNGSTASAESALAALQTIADNTIFAPESRDAPVQILGPLEAAGSTFDAVWVLGAGDQTWMPQAAPNPLLPWQLQRELRMPEADAGRHAEIAAHITRRLAASAPSVTFSYAETTDAGPQRPSPFLSVLPLHSSLFPEAHLPRTPEPLQIVADEASLPTLPDRVVKGGARVIEDQAACPFRSFAAHRLQSTGLDSRPLGLEPRDRGSDVHAVMDNFWRVVGGQAELREMSPEALGSTLDGAIQQVLAPRAHDDPSAWDTAYLDLQRRRLHHLLRPWFELELSRPEFVVKARETMQEIKIGTLRLNLKSDRIDLVEGDREVILDYKTGEAKRTEWLGERPDAPQLPLYTLLSDPDKLGGVAFAQLRAGNDIKLAPFTGDVKTFGEPSRVGTLPAQVEEWRRILTRLATEFSAGDIRVDPKLYPKTCERCEQRLLCRLDVSAVRLPAEEEPEIDE